MKSPSRARVACTLLALVLFAACVVNPVTGEREISVMSPQREAEVGREAAAQVEREMGLVRDPQLTAYVAALGQRLAARSPRQDVAYQFFVANMAEPNAFALPGGYIYVSRGLLALCNSEAELAGVIGHEIGHVAARHSAQRETSALGVGLLTALGALAAGVLGGAEAAQTVAQLGQVAGAGYIASYSRDQERQADEIGQRMAAESGWDPGGISDFLDTLGREVQLRTGAPRQPTFLDSHPTTDERVRATRERARSLTRAPLPPVAATRAAFYAEVEGVLVGPDPAEGVFLDGQFLHPDLDFTLEFPSGWATLNGRTAVAGGSPAQDAVIRLELQASEADPRLAAQRFFSENRLEPLDGAGLRIGGMSAYRARARARSEQGEVALDLTWILHPRATFRVMGMTPVGSYGQYEPAFRGTAISFRPLTRAERAGVEERRLRVVTARQNDTLAGLSSRTGNAWSVDETAVVNGLETAAPLAAGQAVKIAQAQPYTAQ